MYFFDSYAILEIFNGNPAYSKYADEQIVTSVLNIAEVHYAFLKQGEQDKSELILARLIEFSPAIVKKAMEFRYAHKKKKLSMVDCIGYMLACQMRIPFLTGDAAFKGMQNVEFVK